MDIARKLQIARTAIDSISRHDDAGEAEVSAALDAVAKHIEHERKEMSARRVAKDKK